MVFKKVIGGIAKIILRIFFAIVYRLKIEGTENIPKDNEPLILCGNHRSYLDPPLIQCTAKRTVRFLAKDELHKNKFIAFWMYIFDGIYVKRGDSKDIKPIKDTLKALKNNDCVGIFPEGTRNGMKKGEASKDGAAFFAVRTGAKVIPVGISGGERPFKKMIIRYGKPLDFSGRNKNELDEITEEIMEKIVELTK